MTAITTRSSMSVKAVLGALALTTKDSRARSGAYGELVSAAVVQARGSADLGSRRWWPIPPYG
jgi:hypothetical protein